MFISELQNQNNFQVNYNKNHPYKLNLVYKYKTYTIAN